jgi:CheY-like chemotaxis protein
MRQHEHGQSPTILVVDDEALLRMYALDVLEDYGFEVLEAQNADEALHVLGERPDVRLIFTDIQMPGRLNGLELLQEVHRRWPNILLIATSGRLRPDKSEIADHGRFIAKPYSEHDLVEQITDLISKH